MKKTSRPAPGLPHIAITDPTKHDLRGLAGVPASLVPLVLTQLVQENAGRIVYIAPDESTARAVTDTVGFFAPDLETILLPGWDCLPYDRSAPSMDVSARRMDALQRWASALDKTDEHKTDAKGPRLIVVTAAAMLQKTLPPQRMGHAARHIQTGQTIARDQLVSLLQSQGYLRVESVAESGEFAVRGGLIDIFPPGEINALRLDFFGDEVETIRCFDPGSQRTLDKRSSLKLLPMSEILLDAESIRRFRAGYAARFGGDATRDRLYAEISEGQRVAGMEHWLPLFEDDIVSPLAYLTPDDLLLCGDGLAGAVAARLEAIADYYGNRQDALAKNAAANYRPLPPDALYLTAEDWDQALHDAGAIQIRASAAPAHEQGIQDIEARAARDFAPERRQMHGADLYRAIATHVRARQAEGQAVILASYSAGARERLIRMLHEGGLDPAPHAADDWASAQKQASAGNVAAVILQMDHGFSCDGLLILTEQDMLGERLVRRRSARKIESFASELTQLTPGDLVVHESHGLGRYEGLSCISVGGAPHDCVWLSYADGDKLFVPVENLDVFSRYGGDGTQVTLDRLGGQGWARRKARMKERIREIADTLLRTAAARATHDAQTFIPDGQDYSAFVDRFPYAETDDQLRAIESVLADLAAGRPMDRLACGDVGFGKTEVALRAAFAVASQGGQVAIICPTTLLARQHLEEFTRRFADWPIRVQGLSRLTPAAQARATRAGLADGTIDIVVGTHALLAKSVAFARLGLVIVDEEQKFGVTHKERLKAMKGDTHVLTLTATPIPRTLQMAMSGLRDLSLIATPPVDRLAVRTYVAPWDDVVIREALLREKQRGGQSFVVAPRIEDLDGLVEKLREILPELSFILAHGRMTPTEIEDRIGAFYDHRHDVLISTAIVESGLDIPTANTLIIHRADMFGLAQLYQLRGRVGRAKARAYAYLTTPANGHPTEAAQKRLHLLSNLDSLGAGFDLASHDLDLRGGGNLLGDEQSGHIREVGFELYQSMLEEAIVRARAEQQGLVPPEDPLSPQISVDAPVLLPEAYIPDLNLRMSLYRRLSDLKDEEAIEAFAAELIDRFGPLPEEAENLLLVVQAKLACRTARIIKMEGGPRGATIAFHKGGFPNPQGIVDYMRRLGGAAKLRPDQKLVIVRNWGGPQARLMGLLQIARTLARIACGQKDQGQTAPTEQSAAKMPVGAYRSRRGKS